MNERFYGDEAVEAAAKAFGFKGPVDPVVRHLIHDEGFLPYEYEDDKGVKTYGVGQTGKWRNMDFFKEVVPAFENEARAIVPQYDRLSDEQRSAILSAVYRGDLQRGHNTAKLLAEGKGAAASTEYLNHADYKKRKANDPRDGVVARMDRNSKVFATINGKR